MNPTRTKGRRQLTNLLRALQSPYRIRFWLKFAWGGRAPAGARRLEMPVPVPASQHTIARPYEAETQATEETRARTLMEAVEEPTRA